MTATDWDVCSGCVAEIGVHKPGESRRRYPARQMSRGVALAAATTARSCSARGTPFEGMASAVTPSRRAVSRPPASDLFEITTAMRALGMVPLATFLAMASKFEPRPESKMPRLCMGRQWPPQRLFHYSLGEEFPPRILGTKSPPKRSLDGGTHEGVSLREDRVPRTEVVVHRVGGQERPTNLPTTTSTSLCARPLRSGPRGRTSPLLAPARFGLS